VTRWPDPLSTWPGLGGGLGCRPQLQRQLLVDSVRWGFDGFVLCRDCWPGTYWGLPLTPGVTVLILFYYYVYGGAGCLQSMAARHHIHVPPSVVRSSWAFYHELVFMAGVSAGCLVISCGTPAAAPPTGRGGSNERHCPTFPGPKANEATAPVPPNLRPLGLSGFTDACKFHWKRSLTPLFIPRRPGFICIGPAIYVVRILFLDFFVLFRSSAEFFRVGGPITLWQTEVGAAATNFACGNWSLTCAHEGSSWGIFKECGK